MSAPTPRTFKTPDPVAAARVFGCSVAQAVKLMRINAGELDVMATRARASGGKYRGYTLAELEARAKAYREACDRAEAAQ